MLKLVSPSVKYKDAYIRMMKDWEQSGEKLVPFILRLDYSDFDAMINTIEGFKTVPEKGFVPHSSFWLINEEGEIGAVSNLRHSLNDKLRHIGGHIGYGVPPTQRRKGYATEVLKLTLPEAKRRGINKVMITCDETNTASKKTIIKNGGVYEKTNFFAEESMNVLIHWIDL